MDNTYHVQYSYPPDCPSHLVEHMKLDCKRQAVEKIINEWPFDKWAGVRLHEETRPTWRDSWHYLDEYHVWAEVVAIPTRYYEMYEPSPDPGKTRVYLDLTDGELVQLVLRRRWKLAKLRLKLKWIKARMWVVDVQAWGIVISRRVLTPKTVLMGAIAGLMAAGYV